ncbi:acyl-ACP--UDP-N-acetylglucosamine O-acyltransferase [Pseudohoeflea coraliihabitans]|uniref:Acyl-[acyl-carrier-protein]--UDP-N-acetylglucosamine O-acyltransferase n=1 Tax=Pseudohoeflea coraliihabitans TaxID=2860393 RepID=A0ABS6WR88_9HYPH|nr:acyl-ACP--UDP-N-acetylglucosamine O-acyltransferase [Pseudohoeflea sp. DP4N28-3]MBW3098492.1 acyl-ACP--UDP-N-acetylglucosamine O-acyltransferase [Pseudohoeflea sp. DP4N28-3]
MSISTSAQIHSTAVVEDGATIGDEVRIGPFCLIGAQATIGAGSELMSHVVVSGRTTLGARTRVFPQAVLGGEPQNVRYAGEDTQLVIGDDCVIREGVTMHRGMPDHGGLTSVGSNGLFLAYSHVAHDCRVGDNVIMSNNVMLGGHVVVGDHVIIGGGAGIHQFVRVGHHAFIGGVVGVTNDVIPFGMCTGWPAALSGMNIVGMKRAGLSKAQLHEVRAAYKAIFEAGAPIRENVEKLKAAGINNTIVRHIVDFIDADRERALTSPQRHQRT